MTVQKQREGETMGKPWAVYTRVSTRRQAEVGYSLLDQKERLTTYAEERGWTHVLFEDPGVSGERLDRPGLTALLEAAGRGDLAGVLVVDETRLGRNTLVSAIIRDKLERAGVPLAIPGRGVVDLTDPGTALVVEILGSVASHDQKQRTEKTKAGLRRTAEAGNWPGGPPPYGYKLVKGEGGKHTRLALDEDEAKVLRLVADLIVNQGHTTYSAGAYLNAQGIRTRQKRPWRHTNLSGQVRKPHTAGTFVYDPEGEPIEIAIPHIFTAEEWDELQRAIKGRPRPHRKNRRYPLTGRGRCHLRCECGANFYGYTDRSNRNGSVYECSSNDNALGVDRCPHRPRYTRAEILEAAVWEQVVVVLTDADYLANLAVAHVQEQSGGQIENTIGGLRRRRTDLRTHETSIVRRLAEEDGLHADALNRALDEIATERITVEKELGRLQEARRGALATESIPEATRRLTRLAQDRLAHPTTELMAEVFDLVELDLIRTEGRTFEGVARIPLPDPDTKGEVWTGAPRGLGLHRR